MAVILTPDVVGLAEVNRLRRELNKLNDFFAGANKRQAGTSQLPPASTRQLDELAKINKLNLLEAKDRATLQKHLDNLIAKAPKISIAFAVDPPPRVLQTVLTWLRTNIDPSILLQVGLQPNIGAGCVIRTPNREFDLSMRQYLYDSKHQLALLIQQAAAKHPHEETVSAAPTVPPSPTTPTVSPSRASLPVQPAPTVQPSEVYVPTAPTQPRGPNAS